MLNQEQRDCMRRLAREMRAEALARESERKRQAPAGGDFPALDRGELEDRAEALEKLARTG